MRTTGTLRPLFTATLVCHFYQINIIFNLDKPYTGDKNADLASVKHLFRPLADIIKLIHSIHNAPFIVKLTLLQSKPSTHLFISFTVLIELISYHYFS